jgi:hypothetical protein
MLSSAQCNRPSNDLACSSFTGMAYHCVQQIVQATADWHTGMPFGSGTCMGLCMLLPTALLVADDWAACAASPMLEGQHQLCVLISPPAATPGAPSGNTWQGRAGAGQLAAVSCHFNHHLGGWPCHTVKHCFKCLHSWFLTDTIASRAQQGQTSWAVPERQHNRYLHRLGSVERGVEAKMKRCSPAALTPSPHCPVNCATASSTRYCLNILAKTRAVQCKHSYKQA